MATPRAAKMAQQRARTASRRLMALSGAAIVAVYAAGWARTEGAAQQASAAASSLQGSVGGAGAAAPAASAPSPSSTPAAASAPAAGGSSTAPGAGGASAAGAPYKNGTYTATGYGFHGPIQVQVVIKGGRIVSSTIISCGTTYSCSYMQPLISLTVQDQKSPAEYVSGATASSEAYDQAVQMALANA